MADLDLTASSDAELRAFRIHHIGFVFQNFQLLPYLNVTDNILLPFFINPALVLTPDIRQRAQDLADEFGLENVLSQGPQTLSQGQQQRVAICRALIANPKLLIADEPTASLDPTCANEALEILLRLQQEKQVTVLLITHDESMLSRFSRVIQLGLEEGDILARMVSR